MKEFYSFDEFTIPFWIRSLYWGIYMVVFAFAVWKLLLSKTSYKQKKNVTYLFGVFFAFYAVFYCINPDYFRYREWLYVPDIDFWEKEMFYVYTVILCRRLPFEYPYELFRLIVWGGGILIVFQTFRMYRRMLLPGLTLLLLFIFNAGPFSYARASLAMAVYFIGIALYLNYRGVLLRSLGIIVAISSYFFHHEMLVGIALLPCLFIKFEKRSMSYFSLLGLVIAMIALTYLSSYAQYLDSLFDNDELSSKVENFTEKEQGMFRLSTLIKYLNYFYPFFLITKHFWKRKVPYFIAGMYRITYGILMVSFAFMVVLGSRSVFSYRIMYITMIPLALLISYGYYNKFFTKNQLLMMMLFALLTNSIRFING